MKINCNQMDVLISFYLENELSYNLRKQVEEHFNECTTCKSKYEFLKTMFDDLKNSYAETKSFTTTDSNFGSEEYKSFKTKLSAYVDNELPNDESLKIKKYTINNKKARKDLENSYNLRKIMSDSFAKTKSYTKKDYAKNVIKQLELENEAILGFHPAVNLLIAFTLSVLIVTTIVLISFNI